MIKKPIELPYSYDALEPHISEQTLRWHHDKHHRGYVESLKRAEKSLEKQREPQDFSSTGKLMSDFTHNFCGNILHELYWKNMSPDGGGKPKEYLLKKIENAFGSFDNWKKEFIECGKSANGWAMLTYVPYLDTIHNVAVDRHDQKAVWSAKPLLVMDVWEHAYYNDYGPDRGKYIENFFKLINWKEVQTRLKQVTG